MKHYRSKAQQRLWHSLPKQKQSSPMEVKIETTFHSELHLWQYYFHPRSLLNMLSMHVGIHPVIYTLPEIKVSLISICNLRRVITCCGNEAIFRPIFQNSQITIMKSHKTTRRSSKQICDLTCSSQCFVEPIL